MRFLAPIAAAALVSFAYAQTSPPQELSPGSRVNLTMEQQHVIKETIKEMKIDPIPSDTPTSVGEPVPQQIALRPMPTNISQKVSQVQAHKFYITAKQIVIVDTSDNMVAEVIELSSD